MLRVASSDLWDQGVVVQSELECRKLCWEDLGRNRALAAFDPISRGLWPKITPSIEMSTSNRNVQLVESLMAHTADIIHCTKVWFHATPEGKDLSKLVSGWHKRNYITEKTTALGRLKAGLTPAHRTGYRWSWHENTSSVSSDTQWAIKSLGSNTTNSRNTLDRRIFLHELAALHTSNYSAYELSWLGWTKHILQKCE